ncbi:hypothetical protein ACFLVE_02480 [Chloroflexota bacterium]
MTTNDDNKYFEEPLASQLEAKREMARTKRRITYDCPNAVVRDGRVRCVRGHFTDSIPLLTVLRGRSTAVCVKCAGYDDGGEVCG